MMNAAPEPDPAWPGPPSSSPVNMWVEPSSPAEFALFMAVLHYGFTNFLTRAEFTPPSKQTVVVMAEYYLDFLRKHEDPA